jgi:hypothetical protein
MVRACKRRNLNPWGQEFHIEFNVAEFLVRNQVGATPRPAVQDNTARRCRGLEPQKMLEIQK